MKTSININLFGTVYAIDQDAHQLLDQYLTSMKQYFSKQQGGDEIADDIEHRVAEHFWNLKQQGTESISIEQVTSIMHEIGNPEEMESDSETPHEDAPVHDAEIAHITTDNQHENNQQAKRQYYRDPRGKILGGVLAGICHYFGWEDPIILRILFVLLCFLTEGLMVWIYLLFWLIAPAAVTTEQRLKMQGKPVNPDTIRSEVLSGGTQDAQVSASNNSGCLKVLLGMILAPFGCLTLFVLFIVATVFIGLGASFLGISGGILSTTVSGFSIWIFIFCLIAIIALPLYALWRWLHRDSGQLSGLTLVILAGLWLLAIIFGFRYGHELKQGISNLNWGSPFGNITVDWNDNEDRSDSADYTIVSVADFDKIDFAGVGRVEFSQGAQCSVEITGSEQLMRHTVITSEDGTLKIEPDAEINEKESTLKIRITAPELKELDVKGVGTFCIDELQQDSPLAISMEGVGKISANKLKCPAIELTQQGVGTCNYRVETEDLKVRIDGVGKMELKGHATRYDRKSDQFLSHIDDDELKVGL